MNAPVLYVDPQQKIALDAGFAAAFGGKAERYFSAPGRTEIGGNHTDHQRGRVLAAAVNLDTVAAVRLNGTDTIRILSQGYPLCEVNVKELTPKDSEINTTPALIRGVAARFTQENAMDLPYVIGPRRDGDLPAFWADAEKAKNLLGWEATHTIEDMCRSAWLFAKNSNP